MTKNGTNLKTNLSLLLNILVILMEFIAIVKSASAHGWALFQYYTEDSNLFALFVSLLFVIVLLRKKMGKEIPSWVGTLKYMSICCLSVTFLVVITILAPMMGGAEGYRRMLLEGSMLYHHLLCPVLAGISFLFFDPILPLGKKDTRISVLPTLCYAIVIILLNIAKKLEGPYPFLRVYQQPVIVSCIWFVVILGLAYLLAWMLRLGYERLHGRRKSQENDKGNL